MSRPDFNLLVTLDALLAEGSVARAARKLRLSPSAMSRTLARLRVATGDPLLVRAGRVLVPSPRALALRAQVRELVQEAHAVLRPAEQRDFSRLTRTFTLRTREGFVENFGPALLARVAAEAPGVRLQFMAKPDKDGTALREGSVDLETGVVSGTKGPELRAQALFQDRFIGVVRSGHPLNRGRITPARFAAHSQIAVARPGWDKRPIEEALARFGLERTVTVTVDSFSTAVGLARASDLIACVPEKHTGNLRAGMFSFSLPVPLLPFTVSLLWHPRMEADPAHRWLRACLREVCVQR